MALLLDNHDVEAVIDMDECVATMKDALTQLGRGDAAFAPVNHFWTPTADDYYRFGSMVGMIRDPPRLSHRLKSDVLRWEQQGESITEEWYNVEPGRYMGFIQLFDTSNGELIGLLNDGIIQGYRVGATAGVACDRLARDDATVAGILGSGGMARAHALAFAAVRDLEEIRVYSPTEDHREAFARDMSDRFDLPVVARESAADAMADVDIAATCTDAVTPVFDPEWVTDGLFLSNVRAYEVGQETYETVDRIYATANYRYPHFLIGTPEERERIPDFHVVEDEDDIATMDLHTMETQETDYPTIDRVLVDEAAGREHDDESIFYYNCSTAIQFAAIGNLVYERARERGLGTAVPLEWFQQDVRN